MIKLAFRTMTVAVLFFSTAGLASANYSFELSATLTYNGMADGTLSGTFTTDNTLTKLLSYDFIASPGTPLFQLKGFEYIPSDSSWDDNGTPVDSAFYIEVPGSLNGLLIGFSGAGLTTSGGTLSYNSGETESAVVGRLVSPGTTVSLISSVPEPSSIVLTSSALMIVLGAARVRRRRPPTP